jgi:hypothetical protein
MRVTLRAFSVVFLLLAFGSTESLAGDDGNVDGVLTDVNGARISNGTLTFNNATNEYKTQTGPDGTYSIKLKPGTYDLTVSSRYFCTVRRAAFVLNGHSALRFNFQMWVCPTDIALIHYKELEKVASAHLRPLVLFGKSETRGDSERFIGAETHDDGTGHARKYPAILTFNLLTVQADEIVYNPSQGLVIARGSVSWENGDRSGRDNNMKIRLEGLDRTPTSPD